MLEAETYSGATEVSLGDEGEGSVGFGWGDFGKGTVREEEGQNCLLNANVVLQALLDT